MAKQSKAGVVLLTFRTSGTERAAKKAEEVGEAVEKAGSKTESGARKMSSFTGALGDALSNLLPFDANLGSVTTGLDKFDKGLGGSESKLEKWGVGLKTAAGAAGLAVGAAITGGIMSGIELKGATKKITAELGLTEVESKRIGSVAGTLYAESYGESLTDVTNTIGTVVSSIEGMSDASEGVLGDVTKHALNFSSTFEMETGRVTQVVGQMLKTGLAGDAGEAFDLLTKSMQEVPKNVREDVLDAADEYGPFFAQLGLSGQDAFGLLVKGSEQGMYGIDKTGDALKELSIRATDMSTASVDAYTAAGLSADDMAGAILAGGDQARSAVGEIVDGLLSIEDPATRANSAIALFGTPLEDLGTDKIPGFLESLRDGTGALGNFEGAAQQMDETLHSGQGWKALRRQFEGIALDVGERLLPIVEPFSQWLKDNPGLATTLAVGLGVLAVALGVAAAAVWVMNAALFASPITWIVLGIAAVIAAVVLLWQNWDTVTAWISDVWGTFTSWLGETWDSIAGFFTDTYEQYIKPVFDAFGDAAIWLYENAIKPVFDAIATVVTWVWDNILSPIVTLVVNYFRFWGAVAVWLWENAIGPAFQQIGEFIAWVWETYISPVVTWFSDGFQLLGAAAVWLWEEKIAPHFQAIGDFLVWVWETYLKPVIDWLSAGFQAIGDAAVWLWENGVQPAFQGMSDFMSSTWEWINEHVFTPFKNGIDLIVQGFQIGSDAIKDAWASIKEAAATPINWVLDVVWNNGLRSFWNGVVEELGLDDMKLPEAKLVKFAEGGVMPGYTPGKDVHEFYSPTAGRLALSGGEAIMRPEFTRAVGGAAGVDRLNKLARRGELAAFAEGGVWGTVKGFAGDVWDGAKDVAAATWQGIKDAAAVAGEFISDPGAAVQKYVVEGILDPLLAMNENKGVFSRLMSDLPLNLVKNMAQLITGSSEEAATGNGGKVSGRTGMAWEKIWGLVSSAYPDMVKTSDYRPGARTVNGGKSYHSMGRAIDLIPASMDTFNKMAAMFPDARELIFTPAGNRQLLNGQPFSGWSEAVKAQHYDHVHLAMAEGGVFPKLATGGSVRAGEGYIVGDGGRPELFVPWADGYVYPEVPTMTAPSSADIDSSLDDVDITVGPGAGGREIIRVVTVDGRVLAETVFDEYEDEEARL